jgi:hypothetical protein
VKPLQQVALPQMELMQQQLVQIVLQVELTPQHLRDEFFRQFPFPLPEHGLHQALMQVYELGE